MKLSKILSCIILGILLSFFLFPIGFKGLPESLNTKQLLAVVGVLLYAYDCYVNHHILMSKQVFVSGVLAVIFSVSCYYSTVVNNTNDMSYASYITSFAVWLGSAYAVVHAFKLKYEHFDISILARYLIWMCVAQCILALLIHNIPAFQLLVDTFIIQDKTPLLVDRLYGIGASLDSCGVRYATTLVLMGHVIATRKDLVADRGFVALYISLFIILMVLGAAMARTTLVGGAIGIAYMIGFQLYIKRGEMSTRQLRFFGVLITIVVALSAAGVYLYNTNPSFRYDMRFAFEAFFNFIEKGEFTTSSTDKLNGEMWVWPYDTAGWVRGYGIFDPWIVWKTDIGYCRFTLYCGLMGLSLFSLYFIYNATVVARKFEGGKILALLLLCITFIVWVKVSTDIFQFYALLFCIAGDFADDGENNEIENEEVL